MDFHDANFAKTLECPVCLDVFDEPKLLVCGHTVCQKCVDKVATSRWTVENVRLGVQKCMKCPECGKETEIPPDGLTTNYRLVDLVCRAQKPPVDVYACNGCGKQAPVADMFTCETCQETLNTKPLWICAVCAMKQHRGHTLPDCNKATRQQIQDTCQGISSSGSLADMYIGLTMSHLNGALDKAELISQLLNQRRREFSAIGKRVRLADDKLTQEDLAASLETATDLKQKFEKASATANQVGKNIEDVLQSFHRELEELFPGDTMDEAVTNEVTERLESPRLGEKGPEQTSDAIQRPREQLNDQLQRPSEPKNKRHEADHTAKDLAELAADAQRTLSDAATIPQTYELLAEKLKTQATSAAKMVASETLPESTRREVAGAIDHCQKLAQQLSRKWKVWQEFEERRDEVKALLEAVRAPLDTTMGKGLRVQAEVESDLRALEKDFRQ